MKNWRDYVGLQPINDVDFVNALRDDCIKLRAYVLSSRFILGGVEIVKHEFSAKDVILTDEEVGLKVEEQLKNFSWVWASHSKQALKEAKDRVADLSNRGPANTNFEKTWFYKGIQSFDSPIIVCGYDDKYYMIVHPNFSTYGFILKN